MKGFYRLRPLIWAMDMGARASTPTCVVTFFSGDDIPAFLLTVFGKGEKSTLTDGEVNALAVVTKALAEAHRQQARKIRAIKYGDAL